MPSRARRPDARAQGDCTHVRAPVRRPRTDPGPRGRVPPGQYVTEKFPVLHYGSVPKVDLATWDFQVFGEVDNPFTLTWAEFKALPRKTVTPTSTA